MLVWQKVTCVKAALPAKQLARGSAVRSQRISSRRPHHRIASGVTELSVEHWRNDQKKPVETTLMVL